MPLVLTQYRMANLPAAVTLALAITFTLVSCKALENSHTTANPDSIALNTLESNDDVFADVDTAAWQNLLNPLFDEAREQVQLETKTNLSHVGLSVVTNREIETIVSAETGRLTHSQFTDHRFADHFLSNVMEGQSGTYAALYSTSTQQVLVSDALLQSYVSSVGNDVEAIKKALRALLIHELVHAADDSRYGIHRNRHLNFRASFAQSAVYEGHAQYITRRICQRSACSEGLGSLDYFMFGDQTPPNQLSQPVQAVSRNVLEYSYVEGERFIASLARRDNGKELISAALNKPPIDPIQILDPSSFPNSTRKKLNQQLIDASANIEHTWLTAPWVRVETSPLKGVNLRADPDRRTAAIDGFTRLIRGMVALQHYDQSALNGSPVEVTLMSAENSDTAEMFAQSLSNNLIYNSGGHYSEATVLLTDEIPMLVSRVNTVLDDGGEHVAIVLAHEHFVLQLVGIGISHEQANNYAKAVMLNLTPTGNAGA